MNYIVYHLHSEESMNDSTTKYKEYILRAKELNQKAIFNAIYNASLNNISNVSFHVGKVEYLLEKIPLKANKVVVDPPRSGLHKNVRKVLKEKKFEKIVYISCNPKTLVRDLQDLLEVRNENG